MMCLLLPTFATGSACVSDLFWRSYLDDYEACAAAVGAREVDGALVVGDVEALDCGPLFDIGWGGFG